MIRWIAASILAIAFGAIAIANAWFVIGSFLHRKRHRSWVPIFGGVFGVAACLVAPVGAVNSIWYLPLLLDFGSLPGLVFASVSALRRVLTHK